MTEKESQTKISSYQRTPKKVLIFSLVYYPKHVHGGAEVAIKEITDRIPKGDIEFHMVTLGYDSDLPKVSWEGNVLVHRIGLMRKGTEVADFDTGLLFLNKYLFQFLAAWKAYRLNKQYHYDATWAMMAHATGVPAALFKFFHPKVPYILTLQEGDPIEKIEHAVRPLWPLFTRAFTKADVIQVISSFLGKWAKRRGYKDEPVLVPNGVNVAHFSQEYSSADLERARKELGKKADDIFLVTTSRLFKKNGLDDVIRALALLPPNIHFIIFGEGPEEEPLQTLANELGVSERVEFRGLIGHDVMPLYLQASDIFIRPSRSEGMGNAFVEAMATGLPVIATQEGGIADFLFDAIRNPKKETTGWAVDVNAPEQIKQAVIDITEHHEKTAQVVENARRLVEQNYDWNLVAKNMHRKVFNEAFRKV